MDLKVKIISWLIRKWDFLLVARDGIEGMVVYEEDNDKRGNLATILYSCMEYKDEVKELTLSAAEKYLSRYEIEGRNFCKRVFDK